MLEKQNGGSAVHGITSLCDLSQAEFESGFLSAVDNTKKMTTKGKVHPASASFLDPNAGLWTGRAFTPRQ